MKNDTFANRLRKALTYANIKQVELSNKTKIDKSLISKYLKGIAEPGNDNLPSIAQVLGVNEVWLMGYDVPMNGNISNKKENEELNEIDQLLFSKAKELSDEDKIVVMNVIDSIKRNIDKGN